jgi:hypothetical protein
MKKLFITLAVFAILVFVTNTVWFTGTGTLITCNEGGVGEGFYLGIHSCQWALILLVTEAALLIASVWFFIQAGPANVWAAIKRQKLWLGVLCLLALIGGGMLYWNEMQEEQQSQVSYNKNVEVNDSVRSALGSALEKYYLNTVTEGSSATMYFMAGAPVNESVLGPAISTLKEKGYSEVRWSVASLQ